MTLNEYQKRAMATRMETCDNFAYMFINLVGEVGEFASKVAKCIRKDELAIEGGIKDNELGYVLDVVGADRRVEIDNELKKEAGDILWQLVGLCDNMGWTLEEVAQQNLDKLASRQKRGVIDGSGDNR